MEAPSLEELSEHFTEKLTRLTESVAIQACIESSDEDVLEESCLPLQALWQNVDELSDILSLARSKCVNQRNSLARVQERKKKLASLMKSLQYTNSNIPPHLPSLSSAPSQEMQACPQKGLGQKTDSPVPPAKSQAPAANVSVGAKAAPAPQTGARGGSASVSKGPPPPPCPLVEYLTVDEFNDVPKYMKGRLSYQQVNTVIDELNKAFNAKYKLLRQKKSTIKDFHRKRYEALKMQETKETKGTYFLVEKDIKEWSCLKMSKETHGLFTILRHCGRLCEIRSDGLIRYALIEMY